MRGRQGEGGQECAIGVGRLQLEQLPRQMTTLICTMIGTLQDFGLLSVLTTCTPQPPTMFLRPVLIACRNPIQAHCF
jgi:hypothetical protein